MGVVAMPIRKTVAVKPNIYRRYEAKLAKPLTFPIAALLRPFAVAVDVAATL